MKSVGTAYIETVYSDKKDLNTAFLSKVYSDRNLLAGKVRSLLGKFFNEQNVCGKKILIKPNWVKQSEKPSDDYCLCTNENLILEALAYLLSMSPRGIVVADAPIQGCDWSNVLSSRFREEVEALSSEYGVPVEVKDFRRTKFNPGKNELHKDEQSIENYVIFDLGNRSFLEPITSSEKRFRVTCYNPDRLAVSHSKGVHKYCIAKDVFDSDIILTMPKMKTHQKAGITNAMKILVGVNGDKDFLPHHRIGAKGYGGDCYPGKSVLRSASEWILDNANRHIGTPLYKPLCHVSSLLWKLSRPNPEQNLGAAWYGNDTVWRMVMDINMIAMYGKTDGTVSSELQRQIYNLCDGIMGGQGNGPLHPEPLPLGVLACSDNAYYMDLVTGRLFSLNIDKIPNLKAAKGLLSLDGCKLYINGRQASAGDLDALSVPVKMAPGWVNYDS